MLQLSLRIMIHDISFARARAGTSPLRELNISEAEIFLVSINSVRLESMFINISAWLKTTFRNRRTFMS